ncbi:hypothetical protein PPERSA_09331 [Pseudocohnilembus persalinus]|uniref:Uncharacterized protein n=1 Tax=Pseudocohnilembus persalinus TaxID=266149 RepID=A0A0V0QYF1_PSEPJ|nr:hypothetical protein PPERSA_09331 [Pseudocohnilembus persalinus]|eukprot:KRX07117.1 hypothetical protein PPERSA_09331 [Pseudocohnilembus persalinus]
MKPTFDFNQNMNFQRQIAREKQIKAQQQLTETVNQVYNPLKKLQVQFEKNKLQNQQEKLQYYKELRKSKGEIMMQNKMFNEQETPLIQEGKISYDNLQDLKFKQFDDINKMIQDKNKDQILQDLFDSSFENQGIKNSKKLNKQITINQIIKELCKQIAVIYLGYTGKKQKNNNGSPPLSYYFIYDYNKKNFQFFTKKCQKYYDNLFRQQQKKQQIKKQINKNNIQIKDGKAQNQEIDILDEFHNNDTNKSNKGNNQKYLCDMYFLTEILKQNANKLNLDAFKILENPDEFIQQLWNDQSEIKTYLNLLQNKFQQQEEVEKQSTQGKKQKNLKLLLMSEEQRQNFKKKLDEYKIQQLHINQDYEKLQQIQQQNEEKERIEFIKKGILLQQFQNDENFKNRTIFQNILQGKNQENEKLLQQKIFLAQIKKKSRINQLKIENSKKEIENEEKQLEQIIFEQLQTEFRDIAKIIVNSQKQYVKEFNYYKKEESQAKLFQLQEKFQEKKNQANFTQLSQELENNVQQSNLSQNKEYLSKKDQQEDLAQKQNNKQGDQIEQKEILIKNTESTELRKEQIIKELQKLKEFQLEPVSEFQMKFGIESIIQFHQEQLDVYQKFQQLIEIKNYQLQCLIQDEKFSSKNKDHNNLEVLKNAGNIKGLLSIEESYKGDKTFIQKILRQKGFSDSEKVNQIQILKRKKLDSIIAEFERNQEEEEKNKKQKFQSKQLSQDEKAKQQKNQQRIQIQRKQTQSYSNLDVFNRRSSYRNFSTCLNKKQSGQKQTFQNSNNENYQLEPQQKQKDIKKKSQVNSFYTLESSIVKNKHLNTHYGDSKFNTNSHNISLQKSNISNSSINLPSFYKQVGDSHYKQKVKDFSYDINLQNLSKKQNSIKKSAKSLQSSIYISPKSFRNIEDYQWAVQIKSLEKEQEKTDREKCHDLASEFFDIVSQQHQKMLKKTKYSSQQMIKQGKEIKRKIFNQWEKQLENLDTKIDSHLIEFIKKNHKNAFEEDEDNIEEAGRNRQKQLQLQKQLIRNKND